MIFLIAGAYAKILGTTCFLLEPKKGPNKIQSRICLRDGDRRWEEANSWQSAGNSLYFKANDEEFNVNDNGNLDNANDNYSGGLVLLGLSLRKKSPDAESGLLGAN